MDGCVKTLHQKVHGGILGRRGGDDAIMERTTHRPIDLMVVVNLYPVRAETVAREGCSLEDAVRTLISAADHGALCCFKNHKEPSLSW